MDPTIGLNYEDALEHMKECEYEKYQCPNDCRALVQESQKDEKGYNKIELLEHKQSCPLNLFKCNNCKVRFTRD